MIYQGDCLKVLKTLKRESVDALVTDPPAGISFMSEAWDSDKGGRDQWIAWMRDVMKECKRVMKPGAHGLVWALPRTSHWTAMALEDAGFEVRDVITHLFGSGFPKSLDISKAIDKAAGAKREVIGSYKATGTARRKGGIGAETASALGGYEAVNDRIEQTAPSTDAAKKWSGWGTALKPASEHWILVRKPLREHTIVDNVLRHNAGGINIDAGRVNSGPSSSVEMRKGKAPKESIGASGWVTPARPASWNEPRAGELLGRFPANLVLSHSEDCTEKKCEASCAAKALDEQSGPGGASRFFYCAKISSSERNAGLEEMSKKPSGAYGKFAGDGRGRQTEHTPSANTHPTVKPKSLMGYFIKLVTPPGGTVLDPFSGSGSTGVAAIENGFKFVGIEREPEYVEIANKRLEKASRKAPTRPGRV